MSHLWWIFPLKWWCSIVMLVYQRVSHSILTGCSQPARSRAFVAALPRPELVPVMTTILRKTMKAPGWGLKGARGQRQENTINCGFMLILEETKLKIFKHFCYKHLIWIALVGAPGNHWKMSIPNKMVEYPQFSRLCKTCVHMLTSPLWVDFVPKFRIKMFGYMFAPTSRVDWAFLHWSPKIVYLLQCHTCHHLEAPQSKLSL